jgi:tRNA (adenine37-N6)-methyltransferase
MDITPVGRVASPRVALGDDYWGEIEATVVLDPERFTEDAVRGLEEFSHVEVVFLFDRVDPGDVTTGTRHPRGNPAWPEVGIFAQRASVRPNRIGVSVCNLVRVDGLRLTVRALDAVDGTPVLDLKPYLAEFAPRGAIAQPAWSRELMVDYWSGATTPS